MLLHLSGVFGTIGAILIVIIIYFYDTNLIHIAIVLSIFALMLGGAALSYKETAISKTGVSMKPKMIWTTVNVILLACAIYFLILRWPKLETVSEMVLMGWLLLIELFLVWIPSRGGEPDEPAPQH